jgi:hypothetical protein
MTTATINTGTTANDGTGDPLRTAFLKANASFNLSYSAAGTLRGMKACSFGTSLMTGTYGLGNTVQYCLARYHNADLYFNSRPVLTSVGDATVVANRGDSYATPTAGSSHMVGPQLTQFNTDVAAGRRYDIVFIDGGFYNDAPTSQTDLDTAITRTNTVLTAFFDSAGNNGSFAIVWGVTGLSPTICQAWANYWRFKELSSNGRIRFLDNIPALIDPAASTGTSWAWKGGTTALGATSADGTHPSAAGARAQALPLSYILKDICPRTMNWPGGIPASDYDPANMRWADILGVGGAMQGTGGIDMTTGGGTFNTGIPGKATGGIKDKWRVTWNIGTVPTFSITTNASGDRELNMALTGNATAGTYVQVDYQPTLTNVNNSVATRKHLMGAEVELVAVTGLNEAFIRQMGTSTWDTPAGSGGQQDGLPDATSETWRFRSPYPVAWTGNDPVWTMIFQFRAKTGIAGTIKLRKAFLALVEE